jgi:pterin-4a-carbinolamine dehydratase
MSCITISIDTSLKRRLEQFSWVNWSAVGREELMKRYLFEKYKNTESLTKEEQSYCEKIDWHPVDELPIKKEFIEKIRKSTEDTKKTLHPNELSSYLDDI